MALDVLANLASTVITSGGTTASTGDTAFEATSSVLFPVASSSATTPTQFRIQDPAAPSEVMIVTNQATTTHGTLNDWTVLRGQEGTAPVAHAAGWTAQLVVTAGALDGRYTVLGSSLFQTYVEQVRLDQMAQPQNPVVMAGQTLSNVFDASVYGDGSDGVVVLDGVTNYASQGFTLFTTNLYLQTRDSFTTALTINSGVTLNPIGFRIFCTGTLTNNGTISAGGGTGGATGTGGTPALTGANNALLTGQTGGAGNSGNGSAGTAGAHSMATGAAGAGGHGSGTNTGGAAPTQVPVTNEPRSVADAIRLISQVTGANQAIYGGDGGSGGGGDGTHNGGGGGGGGGNIVIAARQITGTGTISTAGGNGGTPTTGVAGGGGGANGGILVVVSQSVSLNQSTGTATIPSFTGTISTAGGLGGTAIGGGNATNGTAGSPGKQIFLQAL